MAERTKNLCAPIPEALHAQLRERQIESGMALGEFMTQLIKNSFEMEGKTMSDSEVKTIAFHVTPEMFEQLDAYLKAHGLKKKDFFTDFIRRTLDEANQADEGT